MRKSVLVLGIGNILCGDDGVGCRLAEYLHATRDFAPAVVIRDGGVMGQELLGLVLEASRLLVLDCADFGLNPGDCVSLKNAELPMWLGKGKMSAHQGSFAEVLALASLKNSLPEQMALLGIQPFSARFGEELSAGLIARFPEYARQAENILAEWGHAARKRRAPRFLNDSPVALQFTQSLKGLLGA